MALVLYVVLFALAPGLGAITLAFLVAQPLLRGAIEIAALILESDNALKSPAANARTLKV
jgi:hypothetical protein